MLRASNPQVDVANDVYATPPFRFTNFIPFIAQCRIIDEAQLRLKVNLF